MTTGGIDISKVSKSFGDVQALSEIELSIQPGELFGFLGPDGAGKTTLFRLIATLLIPDSGSVTVLGNDTVKDFQKLRTMLGYMPGRFSLYPDLSVIENLEFYATVFGTTIEKNYHLIKEIYERLEPFANRQAKKLSGGMKQKLALCCALIHKPKVLLLDEPTTGVDPVSRREFWEMLNKLREQEITTVVSTPYMDEATRCDRVALMQNGKILRTDAPSKIVSSFGHEIFSVRGKQMHTLLNDIRNYPFTKQAYAFGDSIHYLDKQEHANQTELKNFLTEKGHEQIEIEKSEPLIEDCFISLMKEEA